MKRPTGPSAALSLEVLFLPASHPSGSAFVIFEPDVSPAVRQAHNRSLVATAAALFEQVFLRLLQKECQSLVRHH